MGEAGCLCGSRVHTRCAPGSAAGGGNGKWARDVVLNARHVVHGPELEPGTGEQGGGRAVIWKM